MVPVASGGGSNLSGGAIAGIVIGVLAGIVLLFLICVFCCARALFDTILGCFGLGKKNRKHTHEETYIEAHHSSAGGGRRWHGERPSRPKPKKSGLGGALGMGALLGGAALALGLKRKHDKHEQKSEYTGSSYYSDYTSTSEYLRPHSRD
jgi:ubiquitin-activating enzyme E1